MFISIYIIIVDINLYNNCFQTNSNLEYFSTRNLNQNYSLKNIYYEIITECVYFEI